MISGFLLINKPIDVTSFYCIRKIKRMLPKRYKVGHAGTLDPFASGLLIVAIGRQATRMLGQFSTSEKEYIATGKLGEMTNTLDTEGYVVEKAAPISKDQLLQAIEFFGSSYLQTPPIYSALRHKGRKFYELIRKDKKTEEEVVALAQKKARMVTLYSISLESFDYPFFTIKTKVSHGTYIRSLMQDIAKAAGSCATTISLVRTAIGPYSLKQAVNLDQINSLASLEKHILAI